MSIKYKVISDVRGHNSHSIDESFEKRVSEFLNNGWELHGGLVVSMGEKVVSISQAIIKQDGPELDFGVPPCKVV